MANFTKEDRINVSLEIVDTEEKVKSIDAGIEVSVQNAIDLKAKDDPNRKVVEERTENINPYQSELAFFDGNTRTELVESIMVDSAKRIINNSFFPNDVNTPLPSIPDGLWKSIIPFSKTHATGKTNFEVYPAVGGRTEQDIIDDINSEIALIEAEPDPNRATSKECNAGGSCSGEDNPPQTNQAACLLDNGTWTSGADTYSPDVSVVNSLSSLNLLVQEWEDMINNEKIVIPISIETDPTRIAGNTNAIADIDATIVIIDTWQTVQDFDTTTPLPTGNDGAGCALYNALGESDFDQAKLQPTTLLLLKNELTARSSYIAIRAGELNGDDYLGTIVQDLISGDITSTTGLYGARMLFIDLRLNGLSGTLVNLVGAESAGGFQQQFKDSAIRTGAALSTVMRAVKAVAPGIDTNYLNVKNTLGFVVGDRIYVVATDQEEFSGSIEEIFNNRVKLTFKIPKKYTTSNKTRLYKML